MQALEYVKRRIRDFRKGMGMWKWGVFFKSHFRRKMWNFITVDRFENIGRKKKRGGGSEIHHWPRVTKYLKMF
jgi:hypothetical protein